MRIRHYTSIAALIFLLVACGHPDAITPSVQSTSSTIANLLRQPPPTGTTVEVDAYHWLPDRGRIPPGYQRDDKGCPDINTGSLLTDQPVPGFLAFLGGGMTNWSSQYPADSTAWLIPMPAVDSAQTYPEPRNSPTPSPFPLPGHARLRGHLGEPAFAQCPHAERIFIVEGVVTVYEQSTRVGRAFGEPLQLPPDYASWPQYHDAALGYSIAYPPDWQVEPLHESNSTGIILRGTQWPDYPLTIRVHSGETYIDPYQSMTPVPLLVGDNVNLFNQEVIPIVGGVEHQHLDGYVVERYRDDPKASIVSVLLNAQGRTYELALRYPIGLDAQQRLLDFYSLMMAGFRFDRLPGPSPTPPVKQQLGAGPFLSQDVALAQVRSKHGAVVTLVQAQLVAEAEARKLEYDCYTFQGHPAGVWLLKVQGLFTPSSRLAYVLLDATTGTELCGSEILPTPVQPNPADLPTIVPSPAQ